MKSRAFQTLLWTAALAVLAAIWVLRADHAPSTVGARGGERLVSFAARVADVARIEIRTPDYALTLTRKGENWVAADHGDYPALPGAVANLLTSLAAMELVERKTSRPELLKEIGVEDGDPGAASTRFNFQYADGASAGGIILGKRSQSASLDQQGATFARRVDERQAWLAKGAANAPRDFSDWLAALPTIPATEVKRITVSEGDKIIIDADRDGDGHYARVDGAEPAANDTAVKRVAQAIVGAGFEDVRVASAMGAPTRHIQLEVGEGALDIFVGDIEGRAYIRFAGSARGAAGDLIRQSSGFAFRPPGYRLSGLTQSLAELTAPEPKPVEPPAGMAIPNIPGMPGAMPGLPPRFMRPGAQ